MGIGLANIGGMELAARINAPPELLERVGSVAVSTRLSTGAGTAREQQWRISFYERREDGDPSGGYPRIGPQLSELMYRNPSTDGHVTYLGALGVARQLRVPLVDMASDWPDCILPDELDLPLVERLAQRRTPFRQVAVPPVPGLGERMEDGSLLLTWSEPRPWVVGLWAVFVLASLVFLFAAIDRRWFIAPSAAAFLCGTAVKSASRRPRWLELTRDEVLEGSRGSRPSARTRKPLARPS
jgi:hypothetical protein